MTENPQSDIRHQKWPGPHPDVTAGMKIHFSLQFSSLHVFFFFLSPRLHAGSSVNFSAHSVISHSILPRQIIVTSARAQPRISEELQSSVMTKDSCSFFNSSCCDVAINSIWPVCLFTCKKLSWTLFLNNNSICNCVRSVYLICGNSKSD